MGSARLPPSRRPGKSAWTGDYVFENEWQSFRTKKNRTLELKSPPPSSRPATASWP